VSFSQKLEDLLIKRLPIVLVALANVDSHQHTFTLESVHRCSPFLILVD